MGEHESAIFDELKRLYPGAAPRLTFESRFQLLVAVILSAQSNDDQVNRVTKELFRRFPDACAMAAASLDEIIEMVRGCGLYRHKAESILNTSRTLCSQYGGEVPGSREGLEALPGVGRKTAGVVLGVGFGEPAIPVDTHVGRVARRLGLAFAQDPNKVEQELMLRFSKDSWVTLHHVLIAHGRSVCHARKPNCGLCTLASTCPGKDKTQGEV